MKKHTGLGILNVPDANIYVFRFSQSACIPAMDASTQQSELRQRNSFQNLPLDNCEQVDV